MCLTIEKTNDTPYIQLEKGLIKIDGTSMPENVRKFYKPVKEWVDKYVEHPSEFTKIDLSLSYTNSSSIKQINDLLSKLNNKFLEGFQMKVIWTYEDGDDSTLEAGNDLESMVKIPFEYIMTETQIKQQKKIKVKNKITGKTGEITQRYWETIVRNGHEKDFELLDK